jgi:gamma-glutamylcysteine synthetase
MEQKTSKKDTRIQNKKDLLKFYQNACVPRKELMIGIEVERSGVFSDTLAPVNYRGGYLKMIKKLVDEVGWEIVDSDEKGNIFSLKRGQSFLNTEADGRFELASKPRRTLFALSREYNIHDNEVNQIAKTFNIHWLPMGIQPFAKNKDIQYCPKKRMQTLKNYFNTKPKGEMQLKK